MKVFISWSGEISGKIARILRDWLPYVLPNIQPYVSAEDIEKGTRWSGEISRELDAANFGILCITKDNISSPWLNFEAGALSKTVDSRSPNKVCPFLFGLDPKDISGPLQQFQATTYDREDIKRLISILNDDGGKMVKTERLQDVFNTWWPKLYEELEQIYSLINKKIVWAFEMPELNANTEIRKAGEEGFSISKKWYIREESQPKPEECDFLIYVFGKSNESKEKLREIVAFVHSLAQDIPLIVYTRYALGDKRLDDEEFSIIQTHNKSVIANMPETLMQRLKEMI